METIRTFSDRITKHVVFCPIQFIDTAVVDTIIEFARKTEIFTFTFDSPEYEESVNDSRNNEVLFSLDLPEDKRPVSLLSLSIGAETYLRNSGELVYKRVYGDINQRDDIWDTAKKFYHFPDRTSVSVFPIDTSEVSGDPTYFNLVAVMVPTNAITEIDEEIYDNHRETIEAGAMARLFLQPGKPWSDPGAATWWKHEYENAIGCVTGDMFNRSILPEIKRSNFI